MKTGLLAQEAEIARGPVGYPWLRNKALDSSMPAYSVAGGANGLLTGAIRCLLVGMEAEGQELLAKCDLWMTDALGRALGGEDVGNEFRCHFDLALCRWLTGPPAVPPDLTRGYDLLAADIGPVGARTRLDVEEALPLWLDGGRIEECIAAFEQFESRDKPDRRRSHSPGSLAYLIARERLQPSLDRPTLARLFDDFLSKQVPEMLGRGYYRDYTRWVKLLTGALPGQPARTAVRAVAERTT